MLFNAKRMDMKTTVVDGWCIYQLTLKQLATSMWCCAKPLNEKLLWLKSLGKG